jgi:hypothetical protein
MVRRVRDESPEELQREPRYGWRARFCLAFFCTGFAMFAWCYFAAPPKSFGDSVIAAGIVGLVFGGLAAAFGQRMLDFLMRIPW